MNTVAISGRLGRAVDYKQGSEPKKSVAKFSIAVNGRTKDDTSWIDCVAFGSTAEYLAKYSDKGSLLLVEGRLKQEAWQDRNGNNRTVVKVYVNSAQAIGSVNRAQEENTAEPTIDIEADDLPF